VVALSLLASSPAARAQPDASRGDTAAGVPAATGGSAPASASGAVPQLIHQLGADTFEAREQAAQQLVRIGEPALVALRAAEQGTDAEIRTRASQIRSTIERDVFERVARNFLQDSDPAASHGLPGWGQFSSVAGHSRSAKRIFLNMLERQRLLAERLEALAVEGSEAAAPGTPASDARYNLRMAAGQAAADLRTMLLARRDDERIGDIAALLLATGLEPNVPGEVHSTMRLLLFRGQFNSMMRQNGYAASLRKLLGVWAKAAPLTMADEVLQVTQLHNVPEGAEMARRVLEGRPEIETATTAMHILARFGTPADLDLLEKWIENTAVLREFDIIDRTSDIRVERVEVPPQPRQPGVPVQPGLQGKPPAAEPNPLLPPGRRLPMPGVPGLAPDPSLLPIQPELAALPRTQFIALLGDTALAACHKLAGLDLETTFPSIVLHEQWIFQRATPAFPADKPELRDAARQAWREYRDQQAAGR
jgi:hypothetical protein